MKIILENAAWSDFGLKVNKTQDQKIDESTEEVEEEAHVCPLCSSHLDEAISDEALMEHTANVLEAVNAATLNEEEEEEDGEELFEEDESEDEDDEEDFDDEDEQIEEGKMPAHLMKAKKKGKMPKGMNYK
jgi:DNA repair exonuclease SbcCD ATPase subunit